MRGYHMRRRSGATLLEVLVAIFVMGIGMLALLTLFPLGALRMAKAIQDSRCAHAGASATCMANIKNLRNEPGLANPWNPYLNPFDPNLNAQNNAKPDGPSYPVFIDPLGWMSTQGLPSQLNVAAPSFVARRTVDFVRLAGL